MNKHTTFLDIIKMLNLIPMDLIVNDHKSDRYSKKCNTITQLSTHIFAQIMKCDSLRDLEIRFNHIQPCLKKMGINNVSKSSLSDASRKRKADVFEKITQELLRLSKRKFRKLNKCLSVLDASIIRVAGRGSDWAEPNKTSGGILKIHVEFLPEQERAINDIKITPVNINDITEAVNFEIKSGWTYVFDKGYYDFNWWNEFIEKGSYFVTRIKTNTAYKVIKDIPVCKKQNNNLVSDQLIQLSHKTPRGGKVNQLAGKTLRLIEVINPEDNKSYKFITNLIHEDSSVIAGYYKKRWSIELLFKFIKGYLDIKSFYSESENGIRVQLYCAIISYMLVWLFRNLNKITTGRVLDTISHIRGSMLMIYQEIRPEKY